MTFAESIATCLKKYAVFHGRARGDEYWPFVFFATLVCVSPVFYLSYLSAEDGVLFPFYVAVAAVLGLFSPLLAAGCRRLHDAGWSGWWLLLFFVPLGFLVLAVLLSLPSQPGRNVYDDPCDD